MIYFFWKSLWTTAGRFQFHSATTQIYSKAFNSNYFLSSFMAFFDQVTMSEAHVRRRTRAVDHIWWFLPLFVVCWLLPYFLLLLQASPTWVCASNHLFFSSEFYIRLAVCFEINKFCILFWIKKKKWREKKTK